MTSTNYYMLIHLAMDSYYLISIFSATGDLNVYETCTNESVRCTVLDTRVDNALCDLFYQCLVLFEDYSYETKSSLTLCCVFRRIFDKAPC